MRRRAWGKGKHRKGKASGVKSAAKPQQVIVDGAGYVGGVDVAEEPPRPSAPAFTKKTLEQRLADGDWLSHAELRQMQRQRRAKS